MKETLLTAHTPEKVAVYLNFIRLFAKILGNPRSKKETKDLGTKMIDLGMSLMVLAPDSVMRAYIFWSALSASNSSDAEAVLSGFGDLIMEMRKDLVGETVCTQDDVIGIFLRDQA